MPKNADKSKSKSRRKPLREVSNATTAIKSASISNKISKDDGRQAGGDSLDRLLLVHSDISSLLRQIDELVVKALQLEGNDRRNEIIQFANALSDMQTSLKPWVSRFQKAVLSQSTVPENNSAQPVETKALIVSKESRDTAAESPEETKWESLVSPSPLVSWRAGCNTESGRQLFLLTPMPQKKAVLSKYHAPSLHAVEKIPSDEAAHPVSLSDAERNLANDLHEGLSVKPTTKVAFNTEVTKAAVDNPITDCASPEKASNANYSLFITTPCMKMSPPKTCILLEPISAFSRKKGQAVYKSTPFPTRVHSFSDSQDSESSSDQFSDDLKLKYPEHYGIRKENTQKKMAAEDSPYWMVSPPKTCAVMDPFNEPLLKNQADHCLPLKTSAVSNQEAHFPTMKTKECQGGHATTSKSELQDIIRTLDLAEFTPMMKAPMSSMRMGKHPDDLKLKYPELYGIRKENTRKKMAVEDSPIWIVSPPKTCAVMMDPFNEPLLKNQADHCLPLKTSAVSNQEAHFPTMKTKECQGGHATSSKSELQDIICTLDLAEVTPMMKAPMSSMRMGKHPGENTLKKELWMKFEAATDHDFCFNGSLVQDSTKKGFLDILDEASDH